VPEQSPTANACLGKELAMPTEATEPTKPDPRKPEPKPIITSKVVPDEPSMIDDIPSKDAPAKQY
jgi:hypothetical protein